MQWPQPVLVSRQLVINSGKNALDCSRKYIISRKQAEVPLSVPFDPRNQVGRPLVVHCPHTWIETLNALWLPLQVYLSYNNVSALKMLAAKNNWRLTSEKDKVPPQPDLFHRVQRSCLSSAAERFACSAVAGSTLHPGAEVHAELQGGSRGGCSC